MARPVRLGRRVLDLDSGELSDGTRLRPLELRLLAYLVDAGGRVVLPDELLREVWGYSVKVRSRTVFSTIHRLRRAIEDDPAAPSRLVSAGGGYRWCDRVAPAPLPRRAGPVLGRDALIAEVSAALLGGRRLCTVTGAPGIGKTRVVLEVAAAVGAALGDPWTVDLDGVRNEEDLLAAVARRIGCEPGRASVAMALAALGPALVVLDEAEGAVEALRALLDGWREAAPGLTVLVGSRVALRQPGEARFLVPPLDPDAARTLFVSRCGDELAEVPEVDALIDALEGNPLALELAAARARSLSPARILARLADPSLLADRCAASPRHASLEAALAVSWAVCDAPTRQAWTALSVFPAPFDLAAAEAVLGPAAAGWDALGALVDHHLVWFDPAADRYGMSAAVRAFARGSADPEALALAERRYRAHFAALGPEAGEHWYVAFERALDHGDAETAGVALRARGYRHVPHERPVVELVERALALPGLPDRGLALAIVGAERVATDPAAADVRLGEALDAITDPELRVAVLGIRAFAWVQLGRDRDGLALAREAEALAGTGSARWTAAHRVSSVLRMMDRYGEAYQRLLALEPEVGVLGDVHLEIVVAHDLGSLALWCDPPLAERLIARGLQLCVEHRAPYMEVHFRKLEAHRLAHRGEYEAARRQVAVFTDLATRLGRVAGRWMGLECDAVHALIEGCLDRARDLAETVVREAPERSPYAWTGLGVLSDVHRLRGELDRSEAHLAKMDGLRPGHAHIHLRRAILHRMRGALDEAAARLLSIDVPPPDGIGRLPMLVALELARIRVDQHRLQEASNHLARARTLCRRGDPDDAGLCSAVAVRVLVGMGRREDARAELERAGVILGDRAGGELHAAVAAARRAWEGPSADEANVPGSSGR